MSSWLVRLFILRIGVLILLLSASALQGAVGPNASHIAQVTLRID